MKWNFNYLNLAKTLATLLTKQETEATKYFLPQIFYKVNHPIKYNVQEIKQLWQKAIEDIKKRRNSVKIYIHIPFCRLKCNFCFYYSNSSLPGSYRIDHYIKKCCAEMDFYKDVFSDIKFKDLEIRGGSPSLLNERQLNKFLTNLFSSFSFLKIGERSFECNPHEITFQKLKILKEFGFTNLSFGTQSLDQKVLRLVNRDYQTFEVVKKAILNAKKFGFNVKIDLILGLYGDSPKTFIESFKKIAKLQPESIALNPLHPTSFYLKSFFKNDEKFFYSQLKEKSSQVMKLIKPISEEFGYSYDKKIYLYRWQCSGFLRKDLIKKNLPDEDLYPVILGIGFNSVSNIVGLARYQNKFPLKNNFNLLRRGYDVFMSQLKDDMRDYIWDYFAKGRPISQKNFKRNFNASLIKCFKNSFLILKKFKKIKIDGDLIYFLPKGPEDLFIYGLLFFEKEELLEIIRKLNGLNSSYNKSL